jgi:hypothetical protein
MVICFDADIEAKRSLDALMATGQFKDSSEAISVALTSYEAIQRSVSPGSQPVIANWTPEKREETIPDSAVAASASKVTAIEPHIPELFRLGDKTTRGIAFAAIPIMPPSVIVLPPALWLFGQYNKFLPVKASCRALLNLLRRSPDGVALAEAVESISQAAWELGDYLYSLDQNAKRLREESFAAAFPVSASNGAVSRIRFGNQFIGDLRQPKQEAGEPKEVKFNGLPSALKFVQCSDGKSPLLQLTTAGAEFAVLPNPILDASRERAGEKFGDSETEFILEHISRAVPEETSAYVSIIDAIECGANTPDKVDKFLCNRFNLRVVAKTENDNEITQTFLTTQRTGAISRMADLGLVARRKEGLRVTYSTTDSAKRFRGAATHKA